MTIANFATPDSLSAPRRRPWLLSGWAAALIVYAVLQYGFAGAGTPEAMLLEDGGWTLAALLATYQAGVTGLSLRGRDRGAWIGLSLASASWLAGQINCDLHAYLYGDPAPFPTWGDLGYLAFPVIAIGALLLSVQATDLRRGVLRPLCNFGLIGVALYTCLALVLHDAVLEAGEAKFKAGVAASYPFLYGAAFLFSLTTLALYAEGRLRVASAILTAGLGAFSLAATDWGLEMLGRDYTPGRGTEMLWMLGFAGVHWAAWERRLQPSEAVPQARAGAATLWLEPALPMFGLLSVLAVISGDRDGLQPEEFQYVLLPGGILFATLLALGEWVSRADEAKLRRRAETALKALQVSEERLASILEIAPEAIVAADRDSRIELFNRGAEHVFGYAAGEVIGRPIEILLPERLRSRLRPPESRRGSDAATQWAAEFDSQGPGEMHGLRRDGSEFPAEASVFPLTVEDELSFALILRDVSDRRRQERDLRHAKETAELANRAKSEFLANMSHELRTPLNAIIGFSQIIGSRMFGSDIDRYVDYAHDIHNSGRDLLKIINDILDLSKIEAGQMTVSDQAVDLPRVIEGCIKVVQERAQRGRVTLERNLPEHLPRLWADELRVKQMVTNLLSNAVKFTEAGGRVVISVRLATTPTGAPDGLDIVVRDTGIGMDPSEIPIALSPFGQVDQGLARRHEGTGLGLPLVRRMIELHQGELQLTSARGKGTTVTLHFPGERVVAAA
jgi:PAS domain S-box-containing protein